MNDEGNAFVQAYFDFKTEKYLADYEVTVGKNLEQLYYVKDSWENFDFLKSVLDNRLAEWRKRNAVHSDGWFRGLGLAKYA